jgi:4-hydroxy-tetrahydrodipicolinate synthase
MTGTAMTGTVLAAVPTPFTSGGDLDLASARKAFSYIAGHAGGLFLAGTTGEFPALDDSERLAVFEAGIEAAGADRVIAHVGAPDARRAARLAAAAIGLGMRRLAAITPFYCSPSEAEITGYYLRIREAAPDAELYAYVYPERSGVGVRARFFAALAGEAALAGVKLSGSAAAGVAEFAAAAPGRAIYSGADADLAAVLRAGGAGVISGRSAAFPATYAALAAALAAGDAGEAARQQARTGEIAAVAGSIGCFKAALRERGFGPMASRMPAGEPDQAAAARIAGLVRSGW